MLHLDVLHFFLRNYTMFKVNGVLVFCMRPCHWENHPHSLISLEKWIIFVVFQCPQTICFSGKKAFNQHAPSKVFVIRTSSPLGNKATHFGASSIQVTFCSLLCWQSDGHAYFSTACNFLGGHFSKFSDPPNVALTYQVRWSAGRSWMNLHMIVDIPTSPHSIPPT